MGLFNKKRSVGALGDDALAAIKDELDSVLSVAKSYDQVMLSKADGIIISLEGRIRGDLLAFMLYLSGIEKGVDPNEILTVNKLFDIDLSNVDFQIFRNDVSNKNFERSVPPAIWLTLELGDTLEREARKEESGDETSESTGVLAQTIADDLINAYALIGSAFISADGQIRESESNDLIRYLHMMSRAVNGPDASLPEGPAQNVCQSHVRLFGKQPRLK
jgi:hypothetical protein